MIKFLHSLALLPRLCCHLACVCAFVVVAAQSAVAQLPDSDSGEFLKLRPRYISATELSKAVQLALGSQGSQVVLEEQGMVLVAAPPETLQRIARLLYQVDMPRLQVRLAIYLYDVELSELKRMGLATAAQLRSSSYVEPDNRAVEQLPFHVLAAHLNHQQALQLLSTCPGAKLLADPTLTVIDRQTATLTSVLRLPVAPSSLSIAHPTNERTGFEEAGLKLTVAPRVIDSTCLELKLAPEYSSLAGFNGQGNPVVEVCRAETTVRLTTGQTMILGGLRKRALQDNNSSAQSMMNWKGPGVPTTVATTPMTRTVNMATGESELICIVRPEIIDGLTDRSTELVQQSSSGMQSQTAIQVQPMVHPNLMAVNQEAPPSLMQRPYEPAPLALVQSGAYQEPLSSQAAPQVAPSAYRPSVYTPPSRQGSPGRNINSSRNSVSQPLPMAIRR